MGTVAEAVAADPANATAVIVAFNAATRLLGRVK